MRWLAVVFLCLLWAATAFAQAQPPAGQYLYVATSGNDNNTCTTWAAACRTIQAAVNLVNQPNATVYVNAGTYPENVVITFGGNPRYPNLLTAYGNKAYVCSVTVNAAFWIIDSSIVQTHNCPTPTPIGPTPTPTPSAIPTASPTPAPNGIGGTMPNRCGVVDGICNAVNFGSLDPTGVADSYPAIQGAIDYAIAHSVSSDGQTSIPTVFLPAGNFLIDFPLWVHGTINLVGPGSNATILDPHWFGPALFLGAANWTSSLNVGLGVGVLWSGTPPGVSGGGLAANWNGAGPWFIDLKQAGPGAAGSLPNSGTPTPYAGLSQLGVELWGNVTDTVTNDSNDWLASYGNDGRQPSSSAYLVNGPVTIGYTVKTSGTTDCLSYAMSIGTAVPSSCSGSFASNAWHYFEVAFDSNSNTCSFVDGVQTGAPVSASGTVNDYPYVSLWMGARPNTPFTVGSASNGLKAQLYSLRLSKIARHTCATMAPYTANNYTPPTSILTADSNTLNLIDGKNVNSSESVTSTSGPFVGDNGAPFPPRWLVMYNQLLPSATGTTLTGIQTSLRSTVGVIAGTWINGSMYDVYLRGAFEGLHTINNSYLDAIFGAKFDGTLAGALFYWPGVLCENCSNPTGSTYDFVDFNGNTYNKGLWQTNVNTKGCIVVSTFAQYQAESINNVSCDIESGSTGPGVIAAQGGFNRITLNDDVIQANASPIIANSGAHVIVNGGMLVNDVGGPYAASLSSTGAIADIVYNNSDLQFAPLTSNVLPLVDTNGLTYDLKDTRPVTLTGTTTGSANVSFQRFSSYLKKLVVNLIGYENTTATAQHIMMPAGVSRFNTPVGLFTAPCILATPTPTPTVMGGTPTPTATPTGPTQTATQTPTATPTPNGPVFAAGSNSGCTALGLPDPCCTGSGTGNCNTLQFLILPYSMSAPGTVTCEAEGQ